MRIAIVLCVLAALTAAIWITIETRRNRLVWDHFDTVKPHILYRSGQLNSDQLVAAVKRYGIRTVISFQLPGAGVEAERALARQLRIDFVNLPMPGDGFGLAKQFDEVVKACDDPERRPVLIHCARGTCRTGAAVAYYRFVRDGWSIEDVAAEMKRQTYREGWLPGYIYGMTVSQSKASSALFEPAIRIDHYLPRAVASQEPKDVH